MIRSMNGKTPRFRIYDLRNYRKIPQIDRLPDDLKFEMEVVARVLPFRTNSHVVEHLIQWENIPDDPMYQLTFPQREMLSPDHFDEVAALVKKEAGEAEMERTANRIRWNLNPQPAGQLEHNVPREDNEKLDGMQHKYRETVLFFPSQGQTCHAYCTFCFRWPQFVGIDELKFASREVESLIRYLEDNPQVTDVLFTGGDPMVMRAKNLSVYIDALLKADLPNLHTIRIGTKSLAYWPHKYLTDPDADDVLALFERITRAGKHLAIMAHCSHPAELQPDVVSKAVSRIRGTGAKVYTQSPILRNINDDPDTWAAMWRRQVDLGMVPYYMFMVRDTGVQQFFAVPMVRAWEIFQKAYQQVSGICRTVRGPSMSAHPGKVHVMGISEVHGEKIIALRFLQGRNPDWVLRPFYARYDREAIWLDDLEPAFGEEAFFFEKELAQLCEEDLPSGQWNEMESLVLEGVGWN